VFWSTAPRPLFFLDDDADEVDADEDGDDSEGGEKGEEKEEGPPWWEKPAWDASTESEPKGWKRCWC